MSALRNIVLTIILVYLITMFTAHVHCKEIDSATLHLVLYVPPKAIDMKTEEGEYDGYDVEREGRYIYVKAE